MGVLISRKEDNDLFVRASEETQSIISSSKKISLNHEYNKSTYKTPVIAKPLKPKYHAEYGYCIRCEEKIDFNPEKPYCENCFSIWVQFENPDYLENVCHRCGNEFGTSMNKPLDNNCYNKWKSGDSTKSYKFKRY
jgi:hypothetical protein